MAAAVAKILLTGDRSGDTLREICHAHHLDNHHRVHRSVIAKFVTPGKNEPSGFILTTILGIVGAFVATIWAKRSAGIARTRAMAGSW